MDANELQNKILSTFGEVASSIGYSPLHGKIIAVLLVKDEPIPLQDLARETGYSISMISLSLDLLEVLGVIKKVKKVGDRKLYVEFSGDLIEILKNAIVIKVEKSINSTISEFNDARKQLNKLSGPEKDKAEKTLETLELQVKRLDIYIKLLSKINLP